LAILLLWLLDVSLASFMMVFRFWLKSWISFLSSGWRVSFRAFYHVAWDSG
jgi:hypothetical protein